MAIAKTIAFCFTLLTGGLSAHITASAESDARPPLIDSRLISLKKNPSAKPLKGLSSQVGTFSIDGLIQYALLLQPEKGMPESGWPVVIFNHGFHPEPSKNGRRATDGVNDRPGDYYRQIPQIFARQGFLVVAADYRGHNDSLGAEFTLQASSPTWYARDVLGIINALQYTDSADMKHLFMLGHSMGAEVTLHAAGALEGRLKGASIWSAYVPAAANSSAQQAKIGASSQLESIYSPINIHHAKDDPITTFEGSAMIASQLKQLGKTRKLYSYMSTNHLFTGDNLQLAVTRDIAFFRRIMLIQDGSIK